MQRECAILGAGCYDTYNLESSAVYRQKGNRCNRSGERAAGMQELRRCSASLADDIANRDGRKEICADEERGDRIGSG